MRVYNHGTYFDVKKRTVGTVIRYLLRNIFLSWRPNPQSFTQLSLIQVCGLIKLKFYLYFFFLFYLFNLRILSHTLFTHFPPPFPHCKTSFFLFIPINVTFFPNTFSPEWSWTPISRVARCIYTWIHEWNLILSIQWWLRSTALLSSNKSLLTLTSRIRCMRGTEKAPVLPEPVRPLASRSFPSSSRGMALSYKLAVLHFRGFRYCEDLHADPEWPKWIRIQASPEQYYATFHCSGKHIITLNVQLKTTGLLYLNKSRFVHFWSVIMSNM